MKILSLVSFGLISLIECYRKHCGTSVRIPIIWRSIKILKQFWYEYQKWIQKIYVLKCRYYGEYFMLKQHFKKGSIFLTMFKPFESIFSSKYNAIFCYSFSNKKDKTQKYQKIYGKYNTINFREFQNLVRYTY